VKPSLSRQVIGLTFFVAVLCGPCAAQSSSNHLVIGATVQRMADADGGRFGIDWVHSLDAGVLGVGVNRTEAGPSAWTLLNVTGARSFRRGWSFVGGGDFGPATIGGDRVTFAKLRAGVVVPVGKGWALTAEESYVDVAPIAGHLLGTGVRVTRRNGLSFNVEMSGSVAGNLDERALSFRFDERAAPPFVTAGLTIGTSNNRLVLNVPTAEAAITRLHLAFVGLTFPVDTTEVMVTIEGGEIGETRRVALSVTLRLPFGGTR